MSSEKKDKMNRLPVHIAVALLVGAPTFALGQDSGDAAAEMARKLQDPLASIAAIMTDNDILFKTGDDETSFSFQIQPVKAFSFESFNFIARGIVPISGIAPEGQRPIIGPPLPAGDSLTWGLSDINTQFFFNPKSESAWKWGLGPTLSWKTRTDEKLGGPGWGAGPVGVLVGGSGDVSMAFLGGHLWNFDNTFSLSFVQPMIFYNFPQAPGWALAYNPMISYDWKASSGNAWTLPLGAVLSKTTSVGGGYGVDVLGGAYWNAVRPDGAATWSLKWGVSLLLP